MSTLAYYIGLMSGSSLDGIDAVLLSIDEQHIKLHQQLLYPLPCNLRESLSQLLAPQPNEVHHAAVAANQLADTFAAACQQLLKEARCDASLIQALGCHGQTIRHCPEQGYTIQLLNAARLAEASGIAVITDFRSRDIAAGGQGAPLAPAFHHVAFGHHDVHRVIVNIGGIANMSNLCPQAPLCGFDSGPGNALMDAWAEYHLGVPFDRDGQWASQGEVIAALLARWLDDDFFHRAAPKSTGRDYFNWHWLQRSLSAAYAPVDVQASLLALTVTSIVDAIERYATDAQEIWLCGGGSHNRVLRQRLSAALAPRLVADTTNLGIGPDWVEACAFAWFAYCFERRRLIYCQEVTGAKAARLLGAYYPR